MIAEISDVRVWEDYYRNKQVVREEPKQGPKQGAKVGLFDWDEGYGYTV